MSMTYQGLTFKETCCACPEQYDVFDNETGEQVAYVRLRYGVLRVDLGACGGKVIYRYDYSDGYLGTFESDEERQRQIGTITAIIKEYV